MVPSVIIAMFIMGLVIYRRRANQSAALPRDQRQRDLRDQRHTAIAGPNRAADLRLPGIPVTLEAPGDRRWTTRIGSCSG